MAFITPAPFRLPISRTSRLRSPHRIVFRATATGPQKPADFKVPEPKTFFIRPDKALDIATSSAALVFRLGAGALVDGYRVKNENGKLVEYSSTLPTTQPNLPLHVFEFEACPFCKKVREAISILDLDVLIFPCPKQGKVYREYVKEKGGKSQFPYFEDPNTGFATYESEEIIRYLYKTYGPANGIVPSSVGSVSTITAGLAQSFRPGKGSTRVSKAVGAKQAIELYGYEASPFVKIVRETLCELELAYFLHTTARGSRTRAELKEKEGRFQVPYLSDPNTGVVMFESAEICEYLMATYGPEAINAVEEPENGSVFMPGDLVKSVVMEAEAEEVAEKSLDPIQEKDEVLEKYCEDNPESDECRVYED